MEAQDLDDDNVTEISDYSDYKIWPSYRYEDEAVYYESEAQGEEYYEEVTDEEKEIEEEEERKRLKPQELIDIFADLVLQFSDKRAERIAAKAEERKEKLRQLIGLKKQTEGSEETLITPEDEIDDDGTVLSSEGSLYNCLKDIEISNSQLKLHNLDIAFPVPDDPGVIPAFWIIHEHPDSYIDDGVHLFVDLVKQAKIQHIKAVEEMLHSDKINLQYYGINSRIVRPLCEALMGNHTVKVINLTGNWLSEDACYHLGDLLQRNNNIHTLLLAGCRIGPKGAWRLYDGIVDNGTLTKLDLSDCNIDAEGIEYIANAVCQSRGLKDLSLNDNHLDESCANHLQRIASSDTLTCLKLSWNSLYTAETWSKLCKAIEVSDTLMDLDLSWNALGQECMNHLRLLLSYSPLLKTLNLRGNKFNDENAAIIAKGLSKNKVLEKLYLGDNPLKANGAITLIRAVTPRIAPESNLRLLDLTNIWAKKDVLPELQTIEENRPWLEIKLGGILSNYKIEGPNVAMLLFKRANFEAMRPKRKKQRRNFGHFVLSLEEKPISRTGFLKLVKNFKLKLSPTLLEEIVKNFIGPKNTVDLKLLKSTYMKQYPETVPPTKKLSKKKRKHDKSSKTEKKQAKIKENMHK